MAADLAGDQSELVLPLKDLVSRPSFRSLATVAGRQSAVLQRDVLLQELAITFAPYSEETLTLATDAHARGLPVVGLTDKLTSPLARCADAVVTVPEVDFGAFRSLSATIAMAISLAVAVGSARE